MILDIFKSTATTNITATAMQLLHKWYCYYYCYFRFFRAIQDWADVPQNKV